MGKGTHRRTFWGVILLGWFAAAWAGIAPGALQGMAGQEEILQFLPAPADLKGWRQEGEPRLAQGEGLFDLINGGAEVFLRMGFRRVVAQEYRDEKDRIIHLEIYEMTTPEAAQDIYAHQTAGEGQLEKIGDAAIRGEYYLTFRKNRFMISVTGPDSRAESLAAVRVLAAAVAEKMKRISP